MSKENLIVPSDGSKPEEVGADTANITQAINNDSSSQPDLAEQDISSQKAQQQESTNSDLSDAKLASQVKVDGKGKKSINDEQNINQSPSTVPTPWTPSQASTNTMVKGSSLNNSPKNNAEDVPAKTSVEEATVNIPSGSNTIARGTTVSTKNGLESEA